MLIPGRGPNNSRTSQQLKEQLHAFNLGLFQSKAGKAEVGGPHALHDSRARALLQLNLCCAAPEVKC